MILSLLILSGLTVSLFSQDKQISGVINVYRHVSAIGPGADNVTLNSVDSIAPLDTVLLIQMKGSIINVPETGSYGSYRESLGVPGSSEFLIVATVNTGTKMISFTNNILKSYNIAGAVQLIKVPFYNSASVKANLTCQPWDSTKKTGGVLAMIVGRTLSLAANIDVTGKGFAGGATSQGSGICTATDITIYDKFSYPESFTNSGFKGESQVIKVFLNITDIPSYFPDYSKGKGANFTGGGGGNGRYSGGGGGSNYGAGGNGGVESSTCGAGNQSGNGLQNRTIKNTDLNGGIFLGGGGGSSTYLTGSTASPGGHGGGIIIIMCDTLKGKGKIIKADGEWPSISANGSGGAGGGGGGGSIALYQQSFSPFTTSELKISANGGKGGNNNGQFGEGGGGGGGLILTNNISNPINVTKSFTGGAVGNRSGGSLGGVTGSPGESLLTFIPLLNGFLFNSIRSSVTGNLVDSVCSNMRLPKITGTKPVGGSGTYAYKWEKSYDKNFSIPILLANDPDPTNYTPTMADAITPTDTVWFQRTITDNGPPLIIDKSKPLKITVHPFIKNNIVGNPDTICFKGNPPLLQQLMPDLIVPTTKSLSYNWQDSTDITTWGSTIATSKNFDPSPGLVKTTWYRRTVKSGSCIDATAKVKISVLDTIRNNKILSVPQDICFGMTFTDLTATTSATTPALRDGDNLYKFRWESNINGAGWGTATGISNGAGYNPAELPERAPLNQYYFRRVVYSGIHDVCVNTSTSILLKDFPVIRNNTITANQVICSGSKPAILTGSNPLDGNGFYTYTWQDSTRSHTWTDISGEINTTHRDFPPPFLTDTTRYRRSVFSSACSDISKSITIIVHKPILNNNISLLQGGLPDTTICNGQKPHKLIGTVATGGIGTFSYQWLDSTSTTNLNPVPGATLGSSMSPPSLIATTLYKRQVTSGACILTSNSITITVLPLITNNIISGNTKVCYSRVPDIITGITLSGGSGNFNYLWEQSADGGSLWVPATGTDNTPTYQAPALFAATKYKRTVKSGLNDCCSSISNVFDIGIDPLPASPVNAGPDTMIFSVEKIYHMKALSLFPGETGAWRILYNGTNSIDDTTNYQTIVRYLALGKNSFLWTISRGLCTLKDSVTIELLKDFIPQGFSPNGDAWNNKFVIEGLNKEDNYLDLSIVNGAGTEVFSTSNRNNQEWTDWDGKNSNGLDLSEGTYYYMLKITPIDQSGSVYKKSGFIILKRY